MKFFYQNVNKTIIFAATLFAGIGSVAAQTLLDIVTSNPQYSIVADLINQADLSSLLKSPGSNTMLLFKNEAYDALPAETKVYLTGAGNEVLLQRALGYHAINTEISSKNLREGDVMTLAGIPVTVSIDKNNNVMINDANVIETDIPASNGIAHVIDKVLIPPGLGIPGSNGSNGSKGDAEVEKSLAYGLSTVQEVIDSVPEFSILSSLVASSGIGSTFSGTDRYTLFAPTDEAFAKFPDGTVEYLAAPENSNTLTRFIQYHTIYGISTSSYMDTGMVETLEGSTVEVNLMGEFWDEGDSMVVNDADVKIFDIMVSNGVVHGIDGVLVPSSIDLPGNIKGYEPGSNADAFGPGFASTGFASSDVSTPVTPVTPVKPVTPVTPVTPVYVPPAPAQTGGTGSSAGTDSSQTLVGVLESNDEFDFSELSSLITAAGLEPLLSGPGPFTLLAFENSAYYEVSESLRSQMTDPQNSELLARALGYHAINGMEMSKDLVTGPVPTLAGQPVEVSIGAGNTVMVNDARVIKADLMASNGVIHVLDSVLIPSNLLKRKKYLR